ncbi:hypothetical protein K440DRAFT_646199 [Wilcoxina mikolae CBS 423.85]|nr:hypothetical protein K440DRAFT_646199 [Wilcoxina mikolae CBS 423.85]
MDLILVTSKTTMDHVPATLLFQVLESLYNGFSPGRHIDSIQEAVEIAMKELTPYDQSKFMHSIYERLANIHTISNVSDRVREMVKQHNTAQRNKDRATKKLGDYWQQSSEHLEIVNEGDGNTTIDDVTEVVDDDTTVVDDVTKVIEDVTKFIDEVTKVVDDVTDVLDDVTKVIDKDDEAISSDNKSSKTAITPTPIRTKTSR